MHDGLKCSIVELQIYGQILYLIQFQVDSSPLNPTVNLRNPKDLKYLDIFLEILYIIIMSIGSVMKAFAFVKSVWSLP